MKIEELYALLRRRGVLWPAAEIYGGAQGLYDYGPLGTGLKRRLEEAWQAWFLGLSENYHLIQPAEILPEPVVRASGHLENFTDPEVQCEHCHQSFRAETVLEGVRPEGVDGLDSTAIAELLEQHRVRCPACGSLELRVPRPFNLMFGLDFGVTGRERAYLAPETAQASFLAFPRMWDVGRRSLPLGIAVVGHAYRNEIAPRQLLFRMRAFTQAELQIFFDPAHFDFPLEAFGDERLPVLRVADRDRPSETRAPVPARELVEPGGLPTFYVHHLVQSFRFYRDVLGYDAAAIRLYEKSDQERAFYNRIQFDLEVRLESLGGFRELGAVHYRGDYDLGRHGAGAKRDLAVTPTGSPSVLPHVLELTFGVDRHLWALADHGLRVDGERTVWKLPAYLAPVSVGVLPLLRKEHGPEARRVLDELRRDGLRATIDENGSIGKRYARLDEAGTPFALTIDGTTIDPSAPERGTVTLRERDSRAQERRSVPDALAHIRRAVALPRPATAPG